MIWKDGILYASGRPVKGDRIVGKLRVWPPERSKLAALFYLGKGPDIQLSDYILYLGAAAGTTVSFIADYAGIVYAVEMAPEPLPQLLNVCRIKKNVIPIPADASFPEIYAPLVGPVDILYQDIAQRNQVEIVVNNLQFLRSGGLVILMLKVKSISSQRNQVEVCEEAISTLKKSGVQDIGLTWLDEYHRGHVAIMGYKK